MSESILAWHFSNGELRYDYAGVKVEAGLVLETDENPAIGRKGFHASVKAIDALNWFSTYPAEKIIVSRVHLSGEIVQGKKDSSYGERLAAQKREHLWVADARDTVEAFGIWGYGWILNFLDKLDLTSDGGLREILNLRERWYRGELSPEAARELALEIRQESKLDEDTFLQALHVSQLPGDLTQSLWFRDRIGDFLYHINRGIPDYIISGIDVKPQHFAIRASDYVSKLVWLKDWSAGLAKQMNKYPEVEKLTDFALHVDSVVSHLDTEARFHEMLMRLAPEGYEE